MSARTWGALVVAAVAVSFPVRAAETQVLPRGVYVLDVSWIRSSLDGQWSHQGTKESLLPSMERYEPGGGLQGVLTARPHVAFDILNAQLLYGLTDHLTLAVVAPLVIRTTVDTHLGWESGDYQPQLGRAYSEQDFWAWAESMGQPRPPDRWEGNRMVLADLVLGARYKLPEFGWMKRLGVDAAVGVQVALPTGRPPDREEVVSVGTTTWDLHSYGDIEVHAAASRSLWTDGQGIDRVQLTVDAFYALLRPRTYETPRGEKNPLLMNFAPYVGDSYRLDPGDWLAGTTTLEFIPWDGPTARGLIYDQAPQPSKDLPPLFSVALSWTHVRTGQSDWQSESPPWDWDREKYWRPGHKNILRAGVTVSLLRLGLPLQIYALGRSQSLVAGRNVRPSDVVTVGTRLFAKF